MATETNSTTSPLNTGRCRLSDTQIVQNFHLVWLDGSINESNSDDYCDSIRKFREVINTVNVFTDADECIDFITDIEDKAFVVISGELSPTLISIVQDISKVDGIYIFQESNVLNEQQVKEWIKMKGVFTDITSICEALKQAVKDYDHNSVSISFIEMTNETEKQNLDTLDSSFMYTQMLKQILLTIDFERVHFNEFITYCRERFNDNHIEMKNIDRIEKEYQLHEPIWWYTYQCFLYSMVNKALRLMEVDLIIKMGFYVRDLHNHIVRLHTEQYGEDHRSKTFIVYRGQGLSQADFDRMKMTQGGLIAFNNFLSASHDRNISLGFARSTINTSPLVGVLFVMKIDPSISATYFANVKQTSYYQREEEILFSMHSIFRIGQIKQIATNDRLWQVEIALTSDNDSQLHAVMESVQNETAGSTGWFRLSTFLRKVAQFDKAQQVFEIILDRTTDERERGVIYSDLGLIKNDQGKYTEALLYYEKALEIRQKTLPANHPDFVTPYNNIGGVYSNKGQYSKALSYYEKALEIFEKTLPTNHPDLATSYNNIGIVYSNMGQYSKALSYYEKALEIFEKTLPTNHPDLATSYSNIGMVYSKMGEYSKALSYYEKALEIRQKTLPTNHLDLATSYNNIGMMYSKMGEYSKALSYYEKVLEIFEKTLPKNHPHLATSYNNIGMMFSNMGEYSKALSYYEKALEIRQKTLPTNHPDLATSYSNIGMVYSNMGEYSKALSYCEKALEIRQKTLPTNHPDLATSYNNIGSEYSKMGQYSKALSYYERALNILQWSVSPNHSHLKSVKESIEIIKTMF